MTDPPAYVFRLQMGVTDQHPGGFETANESNLWHRQPKLEERDIVEMLNGTLPDSPKERMPLSGASASGISAEARAQQKPAPS